MAGLYFLAGKSTNFITEALVIMQRNSKQRSAIYAVFTKKNYHPTVDDVYEFVKKDFPKISLGTVYRNLDQLTRIGEILKIDVPNQPARYDGNTEKHHHILCKSCGHIEDIWLEIDIGDYINYQETVPDFAVMDYNIIFFGVCKKCNKSPI